MAAGLAYACGSGPDRERENGVSRNCARPTRFVHRYAFGDAGNAKTEISLRWRRLPETTIGTLPLSGAVPCGAHAVLGRNGKSLAPGLTDKDHRELLAEWSTNLQGWRGSKRIFPGLDESLE